MRILPYKDQHPYDCMNFKDFLSLSLVQNKKMLFSIPGSVQGQAGWSSEQPHPALRCPCPWSWNEMIFKIISNPNHFLTLWWLMFGIWNLLLMYFPSHVFWLEKNLYIRNIIQPKLLQRISKKWQKHYFTSHRWLLGTSRRPAYFSYYCMETFSVFIIEIIAWSHWVCFFNVT